MPPKVAFDDIPVEDRYRKLDLREHILLRPDTYIGATQPVTEEVWVPMLGALRSNAEEPEIRLERRPVTYTPGLFKIFDEAIVNAADQFTRNVGMNEMHVTLNLQRGEITVWNNGSGIPIQIHKEYNMYVPQLTFGYLLSGSSYNDGEGRTTGGRNGLGIKLASVFSHYLTLETVSSKRKYVQTFSKNLSTIGEPRITAVSVKDYTAVTFAPDLARFHVSQISHDMAAMMLMRAVDMAGTLGGNTVYVTLVDHDGSEILKKWRVALKTNRVGGRATNFRAYCDLYIDAAKEGRAGERAERVTETVLAHEIVSDRWEVAACVSPTGMFEHVSFVNAISTRKGGTHVDFVSSKIARGVLDSATVARLSKAAEKEGGSALRASQVQSYLWVFINCRVENPEFTSQTKEELVTKESSLLLRSDGGGSVARGPFVSEPFINKLVRGGIVEVLQEVSERKKAAALKKSDGRKSSRLTDIPKLDDANKAGTREGHLCTLILTEGDSAKALAVSGLSVVGRDYYGVFPLRGKLLNVREASVKQVSENEEITQIKKILGLQHGTEYTDTRSLRYGRVMIMTDQDHDGSHIKGLLLNLFDVHFPSLLRLPGFLVEFITPIVKATHGKKTLTFYTMPEVKNWMNSEDVRKYKIKYYKGLGTSTSQEAKEYFNALDHHVKRFAPITRAENELLDMVFNGKRASDRKQWLSEFVPGSFLDHAEVEEITVDEFVNKELIQFSMADNVRSIPSVIDGFKPGQRKILYACFKRRQRGETKVAQLSGYVAEHTAYHHGEVSLSGTIVGMAQDYVGSNNVNLLLPNGQFGTRAQGGKDAASPRYIFTQVSPLARKLFVESDDELLEYQEEDAQRVEPVFYVPILPMVLVNGSSGIGTGWSSSIPCYNPLDVSDAVRALIRGRDPEPLTPWYRGFTGAITSDDGGRRFVFHGRAAMRGVNEVEITELPVGVWTLDYKKALDALTNPGKNRAAPWVQSYSEYHTDTVAHFRVHLTAEGRAAVEKLGVEEALGLTTSVTTTNMVAFDALGRIHRYADTTEILRAFYDVRLELYARRRAMMLENIQNELLIAANRRRFIDEARDIMGPRTSRDQIIEELRRRGYASAPGGASGGGSGSGEDGDAEGAEALLGGTSGGVADYRYLLTMPMYSLTQDRARSLDREIADLRAREVELRAKSPTDLWIEDLDEFESAYREDLARFPTHATTSTMISGGSGGGSSSGRARAKAAPFAGRSAPGAGAGVKAPRATTAPVSSNRPSASAAITASAASTAAVKKRAPSTAKKRTAATAK